MAAANSEREPRLWLVGRLVVGRRRGETEGNWNRPSGRWRPCTQAQLRNTRAAQRVPLAWSRSVRAQCNAMRCTQPIIEKKRLR